MAALIMTLFCVSAAAWVFYRLIAGFPVEEQEQEPEIYEIRIVGIDIEESKNE